MNKLESRIKIAVSACVLGATLSLTQVQDASSADTAAIAAAALPQLNSTFGGIDLKSIGSDFQCLSSLNPAMAALTDIQSALKKGGKNPNDPKSCQPSSYTSPDGISCQDLLAGEKDRDSSSVDDSSPDTSEGYGKYKKQITDYLGEDPKAKPLTGLGCKKAILDGITAEMKCIQTGAKQMDSQINDVRGLLNSNMSRFQKDIADMDGMSATRQSQSDQIDRILLGDDKHHKKGLTQLLEEAQGALPDLSKAVSDAKNAQRSLASGIQSLVEMKVRRRAGLAQMCFKSSPDMSGCKPQKDGPVGTAYDCVIQRFYQFSRLRKDKKGFESDASAVQAAQSRQNELQSMLDRMIKDMPDSGDVPTDQTGAQKQAGSSVVLRTYTDFQNAYLPLFQTFDNVGFSVSGFIQKEMYNCFKSADKQVDQELSANCINSLTQSSTDAVSQCQVNGPFGMQVQGVSKAIVDADNANHSVLLNFNNKWSEIVTGLTGIYAPSNLQGACNLKTIDGQVACMTDRQTRLQNLVDGTDPSTQFKINITSDNAKIPPINLGGTSKTTGCKGLKGCINDLQWAQDQVQKQKQKIDSYRDNYVSQANSSVDSRLNQLAQQMSPVNSLLRGKIADISNTLQALGGSKLAVQGVSGDAKFDPSQKDDKGRPMLGTVPSDLRTVVGMKMSPPMIDLTQDQNMDSSPLKEAADKIDSDKKEAKAALAALSKARKSCKAERTKAKTDIQRIADDLSVDQVDLEACMATGHVKEADYKGFCNDSSGALAKAVVDALTPRAGSDDADPLGFGEIKPAIGQLEDTLGTICSEVQTGQNDIAKKKATPDPAASPKPKSKKKGKPSADHATHDEGGADEHRDPQPQIDCAAVNTALRKASRAATDANSSLDTLRGDS